MLYKDLSYEIVGLSMKVQNRYGTEHNERIFQKALEEELGLKSIPFIAQPKLKVYSLETGNQLGWYQPDFLISDKIIVEIKVTLFTHSRFEEQIDGYLSTSEYKVGYLINFGTRPLYWKRFYHPIDPRKSKSSLGIQP